MDPDKNLEEQLSLAQFILDTEEDGTQDHGAAQVRLAELVTALHEWISKGGSIPKAWRQRDVLDRALAAREKVG